MLLHGAFSLHAQHYFNKFYSQHSYGAEYHSVVEYNNKFYTIGTTFDSSNAVLIYGLIFSVFDADGNLLFDSVFQKPNVRQYNSVWNNNTLRMLPDHTLLYGVSTDIKDSTMEMFALLLRFDTLGHVLSQREYLKPFCRDTVKWYTLMDIQPTGTGEWLMLCWTACYNPSTVEPDYYALTKMDSNFNVEWVRSYGSQYLQNRPGKIRIDNDGGYLLGGMVTNYQGTGTTAFIRSQIIKTDTAGQVLWDWKSDSLKLSYEIKDIIRTKDNGYLYSCMGHGYMEGTGFPRLKTFIQKLDSNRNPVWSDTLGVVYIASNTIPFVRLVELPDSTVITGSSVYGGFNDDLPPYLHIYAGLIRYRPDGSKIFHHKYYPIDTGAGNSREFDFNKCADGGYIIAGNHVTRTSDFGWLVRVDSNGCMGLTDTGCHNLHAPLMPQEQLSVQLYPNPATTYINIDFTRLPQGLKLECYNPLGQLIETRNVINQTERIDLTNWCTGIYIYKVTYNGVALATGKFVKMGG